MPSAGLLLFKVGSSNGTIQAVSRNSSRTVLLATGGRVDIGTVGEVLVPAQRLDSAAASSAPDHPPWESEEGEWDETQPLLSQAKARTLAERGPDLFGRNYINYLHSWNREYSHNQYSLGRIGTSLFIDNPLSQGGQFRFWGELNRRNILLANGLGDDDRIARLDRFSYHWGARVDQSFGFEMGRFLSDAFPEFGLVDGVELKYRHSSKLQYGLLTGMLPEPFPTLKNSNDFHVAPYCRFSTGPEDSFSGGIGYQKTWHKGTPDRDLVVYSAEYSPSSRLSLYGTLWQDIYDDRDTLKNISSEISQAIVQLYFRISDSSGVGATYTSIRWPELLRREFLPFLTRRIIDGQVERYGAYAWKQLTQELRLDGRVDQWSDQNARNGTSWEGRLSLRDWFAQRTVLSVTGYGTRGIFSSGPGGRLSMSYFGRKCSTSLSYDALSYRLTPSIDQFWQHYLRTNLNVILSANKTLTVFADYRFGANQESIQMGSYWQHRF